MAASKAKTKNVKKALKATKPKRRDPMPDNILLKTGSTVLDLALSGRRAGGFLKGGYFWMVGDSSSGKTFLMLTCLAEASVNKNFDDYRFIYDNVEDGAKMDFAKYYGKRMAERVEPPAYDTEDEPMYSVDIEDFYFNLDDALTEAEGGGQKFVYLLDSMDALDSKYSEAKFQEAKKEARGGAKAKGDYGDGKAKINSTRIRKIVSRLTRTGCTLIILSQTRDNIGAGLFEEQQTHAGGHALKFYATAQLWSSVGAKLKRTISGRDVVVGVTCKVKTKKNRLTGKDRTVEFPIYYDTGIDDIGGMVDYLTYWKLWPKDKSGQVDASKHFDVDKMRREDLIQWIEEEDMREDLEEVAEEAWTTIEAKASVKRKSKYE